MSTNTPAEKACTKCAEVKPLDDFARDKRRRDGRRAACRECTRAAERARYQRPEVKERKAETRAAWHAANKERVAETRAAWHAANKERVAETRAAWYAANKERVAETDAAWYAAHRDEERARMAARRRERSHEAYLQRCREYGVEPVVEPFTWDELTAAYGAACHVDGCTAEGVELDHLDPVALGGAHTLRNCRPICARHNRQQGAAIAAARRAMLEGAPVLQVGAAPSGTPAGQEAYGLTA